jgi:hypothetical protein
VRGVGRREHRSAGGRNRHYRGCTNKATRITHSVLNSNCSSISRAWKKKVEENLIEPRNDPSDEAVYGSLPASERRRRSNPPVPVGSSPSPSRVSDEVGDKVVSRRRIEKNVIIYHHRPTERCTGEFAYV